MKDEEKLMRCRTQKADSATGSRRIPKQSVIGWWDLCSSDKHPTADAWWTPCLASTLGSSAQSPGSSLSLGCLLVSGSRLPLSTIRQVPAAGQALTQRTHLFPSLLSVDLQPEKTTCRSQEGPCLEQEPAEPSRQVEAGVHADQTNNAKPRKE